MVTTRTYRGGKEGGTGCGVAVHVKTGEYIEVTTRDDVERLWIQQMERYFKHSLSPVANVVIADWGSTNMSPPPPRYGTFNVDI